MLRYIVQHYILTADPVGSRYLSKHLNEESLSAATIRNVMSDLEEKGFITHPHTSAGRMPTDRGYRFYVDALMRIETLTQAERSVIRKNINPTAPPPVLLIGFGIYWAVIALTLYYLHYLFKQMIISKKT